MLTGMCILLLHFVAFSFEKPSWGQKMARVEAVQMYWFIIIHVCTGMHNDWPHSWEWRLGTRLHNECFSHQYVLLSFSLFLSSG